MTKLEELHPVETNSQLNVRSDETILSLPQLVSNDVQLPDIAPVSMPSILDGVRF